MKDTLLFAEGFIGAAGSMVSETTIGAVDLTQIIGIASIDGVNRLTGGQTPEWMKRDLQGTADNLSSLAELGVGTYTALTDPGAAQRGQDPNASYVDKAAYRAQQTGKALWDKVTHMDAYDAGGLTFEIASLFVGPAAVGKMAKGTKLGAKAAEMIQLAKNSTKARILANVEKWGSKADNILSKSNNVIGKFGEKLLDTRIPVGIRKEAVAFAGGMGTMPTFRVESKTLREVMRFSSKHADDVVRVAEKPFDKERILENLKQSRLARESSKFDDYLRREYEAKGHYFPERVEMPNGKRAYLSADDGFDGRKIPVRSRSYVDSEGHIKWPEKGDGFVLDSAGNPITQPANLKAGDIIDRYGHPYGKFTSPVREEEIIAFNKRGLPYPEGYQDYHQYRVMHDLTEENIINAFKTASSEVKESLIDAMENRGFSLSDLANIQQGEIAKVFGAGGGTQIQLGNSLKYYEDLGLLKEVIK